MKYKDKYLNCSITYYTQQCTTEHTYEYLHKKLYYRAIINISQHYSFIKQTTFEEVNCWPHLTFKNN